MSVEDLLKPLGTARDAVRRLRVPAVKLPRVPVLPVVAGVLGMAVAGFAVWAVLVDDPLGGEPIVRVPIAGTPQPEPARPTGTFAHPAGPVPSAELASAPPKATEPAAAPTAPAGPTVNIIDGSTGKSREVVLPRAVEGDTAGHDPRVAERSRHGVIPAVGTDGARPAEIYARAAPIPPSKAALPRITVVVGGLGISANGTSEAITKLPGEVTLAFTPYGTDLARVVARARGDGHEVMLQVPMEPFEYPESDPGPQTLLTNLSGDQNVDRLHWFLSRAPGYVGVATYMGGRFTSTESALSPVMREVGRRGLLFLDDGTSPRSVTREVAGALGMTYARADIVLDLVPSPAEIDGALARLERIAAEKGSAIGYAGALPVAVDRIARWARELDNRGYVLVPISALVGRRKAA